MPEGMDGLSLAPLLRGGDGAEGVAGRLRERALLAHRKRLRADGGEEHAWAVLQADSRKASETREVEIDRETLEGLRALGYVAEDEPAP